MWPDLTRETESFAANSNEHKPIVDLVDQVRRARANRKFWSITGLIIFGLLYLPIAYCILATDQAKRIWRSFRAPKVLFLILFAFLSVKNIII
jgi:hypothetical protein